MNEHALLQRELVNALNDELEAAGERPSVSDRTIRTWLTGKSRWPHPTKRRALEAVFECPIEELGFTPPPAPAPPPEEDDDLIRRGFMKGVAGTAAAAALPSPPPPTPRRRIGTSDVERLAAQLHLLAADDDKHGGTHSVEQAALAYAGKALDLQEAGSASQRVRGQLYSLAASFTDAAMWAAIDGGRLDNARQHLNEAVTLANLSSDSEVQFRVWGHAGALYRHSGQYRRALDCDQAARSTPAARNPLFASLAHARTAVHYADTGDYQAARRSLGHAEQAFERADLTAPRHPWMSFYDEAELNLLALTAMNALGKWETAEAHGHRTLALLRPAYTRNRALTRALLAHAQLGQNEPEIAVHTARKIPSEARHGRTARLLAEFGNELHALAPQHPATREWFEQELM